VQLLEKDPKKRITAARALQHKWVLKWNPREKLMMRVSSFSD
jgi:PIN domain nuclease of toxin-antitoxin system